MRRGFGVLVLAAAAHAGDDLVDRLRSEDWSIVAPAINEMRALPAADALKVALQALQVDHPLVRLECVQALGRLGAGAAPLVPELLAAAFDEDPTVGSQAAYALSSLGPAAWKVLALLPELDPHFARAVRQAAGAPDGPITDPLAGEEWRALGRSLGADSAFAALEEAFRHRHPYVRHRAAAEMVRRGAASLPALDRLAADPSVRVRRRAMHALLSLFRVEGAVPLLAARLRDPDVSVRTVALQGLGAAGATGALEEYAEEIDGSTLISTSEALERAMPGASHPLLRRVLRSADPMQRAMAAQQISRMRTGARPLLPDVIDALFDEYPPARDAARLSLLPIGGTPDEVVPWLRELPGEKLEGVLAASEAVLPVRIAADASPETLHAALAGDDPIAAGQAAAALGAREPRSDETARLLAAALRHRSNFVRFKAAAALAAYGDRGVFAMVRAIEDDDMRVRWRAIVALGTMGAAARDAVPALVTQLDGPTLWPASEALMRLGPGAAAALPALLAILKGDDDMKANSAMGVIAAIGEEAKPAIPLLIEALDVKDRSHAATNALGAFGRDAEAAVPKLRRLIRESSTEWPDFFAFQALLRIGGEGHRAIAEMFLAHPAKARDARNIITAMKASSSELVETLLDLSKSTNSEVAARAREALAAVQPAADLDAKGLIAAMEADRWANEERARAIAEKATVEELVAALSACRGWGGWGAAVALGLKGPDARKAAPAVAQCLRGSAHFETRVAAVRALFLLKGRAAHADLLEALRTKMPAELAVAIEKTLAEIGDVPALGVALADESPVVRAAALRALGRIDPPPKEAVEALVKNLRSNELYVRGVERLLVAMEAEALPLVVPLLRVDDPAIRARTLGVLGEMGKEALPHLVEALKDSDPLARLAAVEALGKLGPAGRPEARRILKEDTHPQVRSAALDLLLRTPIDVDAARIALDDPELCKIAVERVVRGKDRALAMDFLVEALGRPTSRPAAKQMLGPLVRWVTAEEARPALRRAVADRTGEAQAGAALGLAATGEIHVEGLRAALRSDDAATRFEACTFLAAAGADAAPAAGDLVAILGRQEGGPPEQQGRDALPARRYALAALGSIGPAARAHLPALREAADTSDRALAAHYAVAIARIEGKGLLAAVEAGGAGAVFEALSCSGPSGARELGQIVVLAEGELREAAARQLAKAGDQAVPVATELLGHASKEVRVKAAWVLGTMGNRSRAAVPDLLKALEDGDVAVRMQAAWALGSIGAESALPALEELRKDERMRAVAEEAIGKIRPKR